MAVPRNCFERRPSTVTIPSRLAAPARPQHLTVDGRRRSDFTPAYETRSLTLKRRRIQTHHCILYNEAHLFVCTALHTPLSSPAQCICYTSQELHIPCRSSDSLALAVTQTRVRSCLIRRSVQAPRESQRQVGSVSLHHTTVRDSALF